LPIGIEAGFVAPSVGQLLAAEAQELAKMLRGLAKHFESQVAELPEA
jgi:hypothetical protein